MSSYVFKNYYFSDQIKEILEDRGIHELKNDHNKKLFYCDVNYGKKNNPLYSKCRIINQLENINSLGNKLNQYNNFIKYYGEKKDYIPFTVSFSKNNLEKIYKYFLGQKKRYILKPENSSFRNGIQVLDNYSDLTQQVRKFNYHDWILQDYIENPLLINGRKFHFRVYVIYIGTEDYSSVYLMKNGYIYLTQEKYDPLSNENICNLSGESSPDCVGEFPSYFSKFFGMQIWNNTVFPQIVKITKETILSTIDQLKCPNRGVKNFKCFKLFGYDIIINDNFECFLAEINARDITFKYPSKKFMEEFYRNILQIILDEKSLSTNNLLEKNIPAIRLLYIKGNVIIENLENKKKINFEEEKKTEEEEEALILKSEVISEELVPVIMEENQKIIKKTVKQVEKEKPELKTNILGEETFIDLSKQAQEKEITKIKKKIGTVEKKLVKNQKFKNIIKENKNLHYGALIIVVIVFLKNKGSMKCYKGQIYLYNKILNEMQSRQIRYGFVLGRRYVTFKSENLNGLKNLGVIDFEEEDKKWCNKAENGVEWIRWIRKEGQKYHPQDNPIYELLPNMNNRLDYPWHRMKKELSIQKSELTLLWSFGKKHREECLKKGIYSFKDSNFSTNEVKLNPNRKRILDDIIDVNTSQSPSRKHKRIKIMNISDNLVDKKEEISFYVDFEFLNSCDLSFDYESKTHLYMIGLGYMDPISEKWKYEVFVPRNLTDTDEKSNVRNWLYRMNQIKKQYNFDKYRIFHWSKAEPSLYNKLNDKYMFRCNFDWYDLLQEFRKIPFTQEGVFDFNLKNVAKMMKKKGLIKTEWNSSVMDGLGATVAIINGLKIYENLHEIKDLKEIIYYNEVDCKVLCEMHQYLQSQCKIL